MANSSIRLVDVTAEMTVETTVMRRTVTVTTYTTKGQATGAVQTETAPVSTGHLSTPTPITTLQRPTRQQGWSGTTVGTRTGRTDRGATPTTQHLGGCTATVSSPVTVRS
ncbi:uncharacterized protein LOC144923995 [Branchiostoma floridae x Branchiostoma belcheri]